MQYQSIASVNPFIQQLTETVAFAYQWSSTAGIIFTAGMMAISLIAWLIHRS